MSLRGRYIIDRIKNAISHRLRLPVPPYGDPGYWDAAYRSFGPEDSFEWGSYSYSDLMEYEYEPAAGWEMKSGRSKSNSKLTSTLGDALSVQPNGESDEPILMLGCGNSRLGEEMIQIGGWRGPIIQVDVSSRVVESVSQRCGSLISEGHMNFVQDDATELSAFRNGMIHACLDKGLMDAVYCADEYEQCSSILKSVNRVLKPGGSFIFLSFSRPNFLLPKVLSLDWRKEKLWDDIQVQELSHVMLYRFQKSLVTDEDSSSMIRLKGKGKRPRRKQNQR